MLHFLPLPARSGAVYILAWLVERVRKPWILLRKCFRSEWMGWLVYEIQHLPICVHLQTTACKRGWLEYESGLSSEFGFQTVIKPRPTTSGARVASDWGLMVVIYSSYGV